MIAGNKIITVGTATDPTATAAAIAKARVCIHEELQHEAAVNLTTVLT
jgi:hypothetical protein